MLLRLNTMFVVRLLQCFLVDKMLLLKLKTLFFGFANRSFAPGKPIDFFYFVIFYEAFLTINLTKNKDNL